MKTKEIKLTEMTPEDFIYRIQKINFAYGMYSAGILIYALIKRAWILFGITSIFVITYLIINRNCNRINKEIQQKKEETKCQKENQQEKK